MRRSHALYQVTSKGAGLARSSIEKKIETSREEIKDFLASIPPRLAGFLINDYFATSLDFPEYMLEYMFEYRLDDWKTHILKDSKIWSERTEVLSKLEKLGLCVKTNYYVSTRGGLVRESRYVISPEVRELLFEITPHHGLTEEENRNCRVYHFLKEIVGWLDHPVKVLRQRYIVEMQKLSIDEADVKQLVDKLAEKGVTTSYLGITTANRKPYDVKDETLYSFHLQNLLIKPTVTNLLEGKPKQLEVNFRKFYNLPLF